MNPGFFAEALRRTLKEKRINQAQLAEFLSVDPAYVSRWLRGSSPRLGQLIKCLELMGWTLERAHPDYDPLEDTLKRVEKTVGAAKAKSTNRTMLEMMEELVVRQRALEVEPVPLVGVLDAASGSVQAPKGRGQASFDTAQSLAPAGSGKPSELRALKVEGADLAPEIPAGSVLFLRQPETGEKVPEGALAIIRLPAKGSEPCLRRVHWPDAPTETPLVLLVHPAGDNKMQIVAARTVEVRFLVVGMVKPG